MGVSVAEYFGQRTDVDTLIEPCPIGADRYCPFSSGNKCRKLKSKKHPVCSVRKADGTLWIVCPERLCSTKKDTPITYYQEQILLDVGRHIYSPEIRDTDICVKREVPLSVNAGTRYKADYIMSLRNGKSPYPGPDRVILEMQGGGETTNTGKLTKLVSSWRENEERTNAMLRAETEASTLETNAWRRQQEQFIVKGNIAMKTWKGYGIAFCMGTLLYDYLKNKLEGAHLPNLKNYNWTLALLAFKEDTSNPPVVGPIPLCIDDTRVLYTNYQTFVQALINQGEPSLDAFVGEFRTVYNERVRIDQP